MHNLSLNTSDFKEILSSLLLADLDYSERMAHCTGASLPPEYIPAPDSLPNLDTILDSARTMFNIPAAPLTPGLSLEKLADVMDTYWRETRQSVTFFTSGSTGKPKPTTHDFQLHVQEVLALARIFKGRSRVVSIVPRHHIYGFLFSILLPKALDIPVTWEPPLPTPGMINALKPGDLLVAFPLLWGKLCHWGTRFGNDVHGVTSTGPCPAETIRALRSNNLERMYEIYGSSETGGVGYRTNPDNGYSLLPHWSRTTDNESLDRIVPDLGPQPFALQDVMLWTDDTFFPQRRSDNCVQVAGINVHPTRIRDRLLTRPGVKDCAVRLMRPDEGERLKTFIVPEDGTDTLDLESALRTWARKNLKPHERPGKWDFGKQLPISMMGKAQDW